MTCRWALLLICSASAMVWGSAQCARAQQDQASPPAVAAEVRSFTALQAAVELNLDYCRDWLEGNDFKSLAATTSGVKILAGIFAQLDDSPGWQEQVKSLDTAISQLAQAAAARDESAAQAAIDAIEQQNRKLDFKAAGKRVASRRAIAGLGPLMNLLDGTYADAKAALAVGDFDEAKSTAIVLSELGGQVSNLRQGDDWQKWSRAMTQAASTAARSSAQDRKVLLAEFKLIYQQCESCHNRER